VQLRAEKKCLDLNSGHSCVSSFSSNRRNAAASRYTGPKFTLLSEGPTMYEPGRTIESACTRVCVRVHRSVFVPCMHSPLAASRARARASVIHYCVIPLTKQRHRFRQRLWNSVRARRKSMPKCNTRRKSRNSSDARRAQRRKTETRRHPVYWIGTKVRGVFSSKISIFKKFLYFTKLI